MDEHPCHKKPGHAALRKGRASVCSTAYLITTTSENRQPLFTHFPAACAAARCFEDNSLLRESQMLAWVLMPDHAHWLLQLGEKDNLGEVIGRQFPQRQPSPESNGPALVKSLSRPCPTRRGRPANSCPLHRGQSIAGRFGCTDRRLSVLECRLALIRLSDGWCLRYRFAGMARSYGMEARCAFVGAGHARENPQACRYGNCPRASSA